jgi:2-hydroxy-6-oxonona-2,4-dienedioate hydrolase
LPEFLRDFGFPTRSLLKSRWTSVNGLRWHARSSTDAQGIPFVLVHGLIISSLYMIPLAECLAETAEVHAVDLPGFGRSEGPSPAASVGQLAELLVAWLDAEQIERCHVVANSLGCQVCADLATRVPDRVATLTLIGPTVDPAAHSIPRQIMRLMVDLLRDPPRLLLNQIVDVLRAGPRRSFGMAREMFRDRIASKLPRIPVRSLVIRGAHDPIAPEEWVRVAARLLPNGECLTLPDAAHCVHYSRPVETALVIRNFTQAGEGEC